MKTIKRLLKRNTTATREEPSSSPNTTTTSVTTPTYPVDPIDRIDVYANPVDFEVLVPLDILKTILSYFSKDELVNYYNVNKRWRSIIDGSYDWKTESLELLFLNEQFVSRSSITMMFHI